MEGTGLRRRDTTKGPPLRILSLDGGGVRGYSMLIIIQELMHRTYVEVEGKAPRRDQIPKPCDHFDLICGTGTGGLIALMLGRLRLDLETCKEVYVRMTRKVFETDKTIAGIPYRSTLFKASKLEEAIRECVRDHTVLATEGNDGGPVQEVPTPITPGGSSAGGAGVRRQLSNASVLSFSARSPTSQMNRPNFSRLWGDPNALLYDTREYRTKTAVTAMYKGSQKGSPPALLRSYDSRSETAVEFDCTIWEAGRATSATGLAFKPIQIGQSVFIDEGPGQYNPAPVALDEAAVREWPGREVGVFVSIGTGKRPPGSDQNKHLWYEDFMGDFAEARRRLIAKIEGCEDTHQLMLKEYLAKRGVNRDNYYRLNVEIGVGEFGMNEWNRLSDISTNTRRYLGKSEIQAVSLDAATKLGRIYKARARLEGKDPGNELAYVPESHPLAVELPAEVPIMPPYSPPPRLSYESGADKLGPPPPRISPRTSDDYQRRHHHSPSNNHSNNPATNSSSTVNSKNDDRFVINAPTPAQYRNASGGDKIAITSADEYPRRSPPPVPQQQQYQQQQQQEPQVPPKIPGPRREPPPLPPKTPMIDGAQLADRRRLPHQQSQSALSQTQGGQQPPYPVDDGPPPAVNMARKPADYMR